jgi:dTDP-4-dehydrorhamnose 3,5-epimerase
MEVTRTSIPGLVAFRPTPIGDSRGFFCRTFDADVARSAGLDPDSFRQDSLSRSAYGVVRGLHVRVGDGEGKLVRCSSGRVFDVVVDLRPGSPAYRSWLSFDLDGEQQNSIFIPPGCAHGFQALTPVADTSYRIDRAHEPDEDLTVAWNDPELAIPWPLEPTNMSAKDATAPPLADLGRELARIRAEAP